MCGLCHVCVCHVFARVFLVMCVSFVFYCDLMGVCGVLCVCVCVGVRF